MIVQLRQRPGTNANPIVDSILASYEGEPDYLNIPPTLNGGNTPCFQYRRKRESFVTTPLVELNFQTTEEFATALTLLYYLDAKGCDVLIHTDACLEFRTTVRIKEAKNPAVKMFVVYVGDYPLKEIEDVIAQLRDTDVTTHDYKDFALAERRIREELGLPLPE